MAQGTPAVATSRGSGVKDQSLAGPPPQAGQSILKFEVYCPYHLNQEMLTGGKQIEYGERIVASCPICKLAVIVRVVQIQEGG